MAKKGMVISLCAIIIGLSATLYTVKNTASLGRTNTVASTQASSLESRVQNASILTQSNNPLEDSISTLRKIKEYDQKLETVVEGWIDKIKVKISTEL